MAKFSDALVKKMFKEARASIKNSNYPKNKAFGAAILTYNNKIYTGTCFQIFPQSICAEKVALVKALSEGENDIRALLITSRRKEIFWPCGYCRRDFYKLLNGNNLIIISHTCGKNPKYYIKTLKELFPEPF